MLNATFSLTETGSVRNRNEDSFLVNAEAGLFAVADGLGGLPNGGKASSMAIEILQQKIVRQPSAPLAEIIADVNQDTRKVGFILDDSGFGTTLTLARYNPDANLLEIAHVGDSAAYLVREGRMQLLTVEHTVAARMVASQWNDAEEAIPLSAHHTLTQCIGQDLYIDPQVLNITVQPGDRFFLLTDGVTKPISESQLADALTIKDDLDRVCQALTFRIEINGSPDNYTMVAVEF